MRHAVVVLPLLLAACGFQLRGADVLPAGMSRVLLVAPEVLREEVSIYLEGTGAQLVDDRAVADVVLTISNARYDRRVLSVDPSTGKEREFELSYSLDVKASRADGTTLLAHQSVSLLRDYVFDRQTLIGSGQEEAVLREEMRRDAVQQVLHRLRVAARG